MMIPNTTTTTQYGTAQIVVVDNNNNNTTNSYSLELERFMDSDDNILPFYRIPLTGEHLAAWTVNNKRSEGCRCKRLTTTSNHRAMASIRRATQKDGGLVCYHVESSSSDSMTIVSAGKASVVKYGILTPQEQDSFIHYITGLLCDDDDDQPS